ncbi:hypothetical protein Tco_0156062 [Tanacetum coccineum]
MTNAKVEDSDKGDEEVTDAAKADAEKTSEVKVYAKKTELSPTSSSLSVSSRFSDQFRKLSSDSSLVSTVKDTAYADVSSLMDIPIQQETPQIHDTYHLIRATNTNTNSHTTNAPTITTVVLESDALSAVQLRVAKLEKYVFELKKIDLFTEALASLKTQVPFVVDNYLRSKVGDVPKNQTPTVDLEQESEKSPLEILKIKKEQAKKQKMPKFTIKSTDKAALIEYDQKSALYQTMHANKSFDKNPANHRLYHALMKALIKDENAMDKGVADIVQDYKRKLDDDEDDDDEDDDDEDPLAGPNQAKHTKRRRTKESESSKKPSTTKETPKGKAPSKGSKTSKSTSAKEPIEEPIAEVVMDDAGDDDQPQNTSEPKIAKNSNPEWFKQPPRPPTPDPKWNKRQVVLDQTEQPWFNQMVSATKDPLTFNDLMATPIDFSKYVLNGLKIDNLTQDILLGPAFNLLKGTCSSSIELEYNFQESFNALTNRLDWNNPKGDRYPFDLSKPLPLQGPPGHQTVAVDYFFNNDLEYLKTSDPEVTYTTFITKTKATRYEINGIEDMVPTIWSPIKVGYDKDALMGIKHCGERRKLWYRSQLYKFKESNFVDLHLNDIEDMLLLAVQHKLFHLDGSDIVDFIVALQPYTPSYNPPGIVYEDLNKQKRVMRADELYKFLDVILKSVRDELYHIVLDFCLDYNTEMPKRKWTAIDRKRSGLMIDLIDKQLRKREIIQNLERLVGARELEMDYKLMTRTI